ncbi:MAG: hypothetical protein IJ572_05550 [Bacilli bacterium]|nr:hypothetical protein [Bacilli bacterium]
MKKYIRAIIYFVLFAILIGAFIYLGEKDFASEKGITDAKRFSQEYYIGENNPFKYIYGSEAVDIIKNKTGIIYMGFSSNDWSKYYARYLNEAARENDIKTIYYYDLAKDRAKYTKYYRELESILSDYLYELDTGVVRLSTPALVIIKDGKIIFFDDETAIERNNVNPKDYWVQERIQTFKNRLSIYFKEVK